MKLKRKKKKNPSEPKQKQKADKGIYQSDTNDMDDLFGISNAPSVQEDSSGQIDRSKLVKKVQNQLSIIKNKKMRTTILCSIALFIIVGYLFFFTSQRILPDGYLYSATPINTALEMETDRTLTVVRWDYSPTQGIAEIEFEINNRNFDDSDRYNVSCMVKEQNTERTVNYKAIVQDSDYFVIQMEAPDGWGELIFNIQINDDRHTKNITQLVATKESISTVDEIQAKTRAGYLQERMKKAVADYQESIKRIQDENEELTEKIERIQNRNTELENDKKYQTNEQIAKTESEINDNIALINSTKSKITENIRSISKYEQLIQETKETYKRSLSEES